MNIYPSTKPAPYVYMCIHKETSEFYIGYRCNNKLPSHLDLPKYKSSATIVHSNFGHFTWSIVAEFFDSDSAYDFEQLLIHDNWGNPLMLNKSCFFDKPRFKRTEESILKQKGRSPSNIQPIEQLIKDTAAILGISRGKNQGYKLKYASSVDNAFTLNFSSNREREEFILSNPSFKKVEMHSTESKQKIREFQSGREKPRTEQHTSNWKKSYPKTNKNKGVPKSEEHKQKTKDSWKDQIIIYSLTDNKYSRTSSLGEVPEGWTTEKPSWYTHQRGKDHKNSKFDNIPLELLINSIVDDHLTIREISLNYGFSVYLIKRKLSTYGINSDGSTI